MIDADLAFLDATAQAALVRNRKVTPLELVDAAIDRVEKLDPDLNATVYSRAERARTEAASPLLPDGPFRGVPIVVKDFDGTTAGDPYHCGNRLLKSIGYVADHDSYLHAKLRAAGFVFVAKTNLPEFGLLPVSEPEAYGPSRNPWDVTRSPGGSSGGTAAAVASGMVPLGHGGDGGGSIRIPASMCGLFGLKPSRGRVSLGPDDGEAWAGLVVRHVITRTVRDSAAVLDVLAGPMPGDPYAAPLPIRPYVEEIATPPDRLRIGIRTSAPSSLCETDPACVAAAEDAARLLESLGHTVEPAAPAALDDLTLLASFSTITNACLVHDLRRLASLVGRDLAPDDVEPATWAQYGAGLAVTAGDYLDAVADAHAWTRRLAAWWTGDEPGSDGRPFDLLLTPTLAQPPPEIGALRATTDDPLAALVNALPFAIYTAPFNVSGQPAMSVPLRWSDALLPVGVQLVADHYREDLLLRLAAQLERARPWADRRPPVHA
ncbi:MAG TPA: amidase [Acidimicrobiia bacterium]|nr:amidase [Acidimicrobiia bacterium]